MSNARDLTDDVENQAVLDLATRYADGHDTGDHRPAVAAEARAAALSRHRLAAAEQPVHLSVVWAMYGETGRMANRREHPHGEDFVRAKVRQLDWLTAGLDDVTWDIVACDDGCPDRPSSADVMTGIVTEQGYHNVRIIRLADVIDGTGPSTAHLRRLTSTDQSRKGGSILAGLAAAIDTAIDQPRDTRHIVCYTDADLSANLAQLGSLAAPVLDKDATAVLGQRYGMPGAVLVKADGPVEEPHSTGDKPDKLIILFRHFVRALLIPDLAHVLDTQAGFKAFDAAALRPVLPEMTSFDETFDVELLIHLAQRYGRAAIAVQPIVFTEDFAATNFPSVDPGARHLAMVRQVVDLHDRFVAPVAPATGEAADLLGFLRDLDLNGYVRLIEGLRAIDDDSLFDRRWPVAELRRLA